MCHDFCDKYKRCCTQAAWVFGAFSVVIFAVAGYLVARGHEKDKSSMRDAGGWILLAWIIVTFIYYSYRIYKGCCLSRSRISFYDSADADSIFSETNHVGGDYYSQV